MHAVYAFEKCRDGVQLSNAASAVAQDEGARILTPLLPESQQPAGSCVLGNLQAKQQNYAVDDAKRKEIMKIDKTLQSSNSAVPLQTVHLCPACSC